MPEWDMHSDPLPLLPEGADLAPGTQVEGSVICHHPYGFGVRLSSVDQYGHVNITDVSDAENIRESDFPPIGSVLALTVLGYSGVGRQLRLSARR